MSSAKTSTAVDHGRICRKLREARGMRQEDVARALDLNRTSMSNIEAGAQKLTLAHAINLANLFGVTLDTIAGMDGQHINGFEAGYQAGFTVGRDRVIDSVLRAMGVDPRKGEQ